MVKKTCAIGDHAVSENRLNTKVDQETGYTNVHLLSRVDRVATHAGKYAAADTWHLRELLVVVSVDIWRCAAADIQRRFRFMRCALG